MISSAVPAPWFTKKLPCLSETPTFPMRLPKQPARSINQPAGILLFLITPASCASCNTSAEISLISGFLKKDVRLTQKKETLRIKFTTKNAKKIQRHIAAIQQKIKIYEKMRTFL